MGTLQSLTAGALLARLGIRGFRGITVDVVKGDKRSLSVAMDDKPLAILHNGCLFTSELQTLTLSAVVDDKTDGQYILYLDETDDGTQAPKYVLKTPSDMSDDLLALAYVDVHDGDIISVVNSESGLEHPFHSRRAASTTHQTGITNSSSEVSPLGSELNAADQTDSAQTSSPKVEETNTAESAPADSVNSEQNVEQSPEPVKDDSSSVDVTPKNDDNPNAAGNSSAEPEIIFPPAPKVVDDTPLTTSSDSVPAPSVVKVSKTKSSLGDSSATTGS